METKKIGLVLILLMFLSSMAFASITSYKVPENVPLNQGITATGLSLDDTNTPNVNQLCSFYFYDSSDNLVDRMTDQYTDQTGRFAMPQFILTEPNFQRGITFNLQTNCGSNSVDANFVVGQKQEVVPFIYPQGLINDLMYWNNKETGFLLFMFLIVLIVFSGGIYLVYKQFF